MLNVGVLMVPVKRKRQFNPPEMHRFQSNSRHQQSFEFCPEMFHMSLFCLCFWDVVVYAHTVKITTLAARVRVKLLRIKSYARLGGKTVSNDATRGRAQAAEA